MRAAVQFAYPKVTSSWSVVLAIMGEPRSMKNQLVRINPLFLAGLFDQSLRQSRAFPGGYQPAHNVPAEDIEYHVEIEIDPLDWPSQLGNVPGPNLIRGLCRHFRIRPLSLLSRPQPGGLLSLVPAFRLATLAGT